MVDTENSYFDPIGQAPLWTDWQYLSKPVAPLPGNPASVLVFRGVLFYSVNENTLSPAGTIRSSLARSHPIPESMLYHGPVRVPNDARPGSVVIRVELTEQSAFKSLPADIEVKLVK